MATTPVSTGLSWSSIIPILEGLGNLALIGLTGAGIVPPGSAQLASSLEASITALVVGMSTGASTSQDVVNGYAVVIGAFKAYQMATSDTKLSAQIGAYLASVEAGLAGFLAAENGYNPANYSPVA